MAMRSSRLECRTRTALTRPGRLFHQKAARATTRDELTTATNQNIVNDLAKLLCALAPASFGPPSKSTTYPGAENGLKPQVNNDIGTKWRGESTRRVSHRGTHLTELFTAVLGQIDLGDLEEPSLQITNQHFFLEEW